jgi:hypothetical protein
MKYYLFGLIASLSLFSFAQNSGYKKRVLESTEIELLSSYYSQDGVHSVIGGGIGTEELTDATLSIILTTPLNDDDVLTVDAGVSAYTSASSSNVNPFNSTGASGGGGDDDDDDDDRGRNNNANSAPTGTPWAASSGASRSDELFYLNASFSHSSESRNFIWNAHASVSNEYDYTSFGVGGGITKLFNEKNTEVSLGVNAYFDTWRPIYPTELHEYSKYGDGFLNQGFFQGVTVLDQNGNASTAYRPTGFNQHDQTNRNSYAATLGFSQILTKRLQVSLSIDVLLQDGLLATPYHRIYFADKPKFYIGNAASIPFYTDPRNKDVFRLADDVEQLPNNRFKLPVGLRANYYISEMFALRTYYRYYYDDWGITSHTANFELPVKITRSITLLPMYRYYTQTQADYFAPYNQHVSTEKYYTSDYDLSAFDSNQYGIGATYTDIFTRLKVGSFGLKSIDLRYNNYERSDGLNANIVTFGLKFIQN